MKIDMKSILNGEKDSIVIDYEFMLPKEYLSDDITIDKPVKVDGMISAYSGYTELTLHSNINYTVECARCLTPINDKLLIDFSKTIALGKSYHVEGTLENEDNDDYIIIEDGMINIAVPLIEQISMELPLKQLCSDNCKGLCPSCGKNLNISDCGCETKKIDPRLAVLQQFLDKDEK